MTGGAAGRGRETHSWEATANSMRWGQSESQPLTAPAAPWHTGPQPGSAAPAALCRPLAASAGERAPAGFYRGCLEPRWRWRWRSPRGSVTSAIPAQAPRDCSHR